MKVKIKSGYILNGEQVNGKIINADTKKLDKLKVKWEKVEIKKHGDSKLPRKYSDD